MHELHARIEPYHLLFLFFFNDTATTEIYTLSLHDALPISVARSPAGRNRYGRGREFAICRDRKSTRLNSSHVKISYAVFCLKKKTRQHANIAKRNVDMRCCWKRSDQNSLYWRLPSSLSLFLTMIATSPLTP